MTRPTSAIDFLRLATGAAGGFIAVMMLATLRHYATLYRLGKETSPPRYVAGLRLSHAALACYAALDLFGYVGRRPMTWRCPLFAAAALAGVYGAVGVMRYVYTELSLRQRTELPQQGPHRS